MEGRLWREGARIFTDAPPANKSRATGNVRFLQNRSLRGHFRVHGGRFRMKTARQYGTSRVLVTGGAGFIGSHLCARLLREGLKKTIPYFEGLLKRKRS
jgi:hypothetical protein